jgi:hypothetical protein
MPPDVRDWLAEGHLAWFVIDAVGEMESYTRMLWTGLRKKAAYLPG